MQDRLEIYQCNISLNADDQIILMELEANWKNIPIHYSVFLDESRERYIESNLKFKHFELVDYLPNFPEINPDFNQVSGHINFNTDEGNTKTNLKAGYFPDWLWLKINQDIHSRFSAMWLIILSDSQS